MELTQNKIIRLDSKEIFEILLPTISKIYESIKYTGIKKEEFDSLVLKEISNS